MTTPTPRPATELAAALESRQLSARELLTETYERIERQSGLDIFISVTDFETLERQALSIDEARAKGAPLPAYAGIPIAVKDNIAVRGLPLTCGSRILEHHVPVYDATVVERVVSQGMLIVGKTNMDEFGFGSSTENSAFFATKNPRDPSKVPGGTSGGSAAAVAAGIVPWALGTDTGGSIRQPASLCGTVGLRPTYGRVSRFGVVAYASSMDQVGPLARTVDDAAVLFEIISGHDPRDSTSIPQPAPGVRPPTGRPATAAIPREYLEGAQPEVAQTILRIADELALQGWTIVETSLRLTDVSLPVYYLISSVEAASNLARYDGVKYGFAAEGAGSWDELVVRSRSEAFGAEAKRRIMLGTYASSAGYTARYYEQACRVRTLIKREFEEVLQQADVILSPVSPTTAWPLGQRTSDPMRMYLADVYSVPVALAGLPAIVIPGGRDQEGLPIGVQITGSALREDLVMAAAFQLESIVGSALAI